MGREAESRDAAEVDDWRHSEWCMQRPTWSKPEGSWIKTPCRCGLSAFRAVVASGGGAVIPDDQGVVRVVGLEEVVPEGWPWADAENPALYRLTAEGADR
jgi:hypothetical protein